MRKRDVEKEGRNPHLCSGAFDGGGCFLPGGVVRLTRK